MKKMKNEEKSVSFSSDTGKSGAPVVFFDSGIGGLSVLKEYLRYKIGVPVYYYGDNERAPYGNLPVPVIRAYVRESLNEIINCRPVAVVLACNTATAYSRDFWEEYPYPIFGIAPDVESVGDGETYVFATSATVKSPLLKEKIEKAESDCKKIVPIAMDTLAGEIEKYALAGSFPCFYDLFKVGHPKNVVLGCTHYSFIKEQFEAYYRCPIYDAGSKVAKKVADYVKKASENGTIGDDTNKRSDYFTKIGVMNTEIVENTPVFFLGSGKEKNKAVFEHMFGYKRG